MNAPLPDSIRKALETVVAGRQIRARHRPRLHERRAGAGAPADAAAHARRAGRPEHRRLHQRLPRLAARRLRPGAVERQEAPGRRRTSCSSRASTRSSAPPRSGARSSSRSIRRPTSSTACSASGTARARASTAAADVFKHANMAGTSTHGGVIAIAGDDHVSKSSTAAHQSDHIFKACGMPVFFPSSACRTSSTWACTRSR